MLWLWRCSDGPPFAKTNHTLLFEGGDGGVSVLHTQGLASTMVILADDTDIKVVVVMYARGHPSAPDSRLLYKASAGLHTAQVTLILVHCQGQHTADGPDCSWHCTSGPEALPRREFMLSAKTVGSAGHVTCSLLPHNTTSSAARAALRSLSAGCPDILQHQGASVPTETLELFEQLMLWLHCPTSGNTSLVRLRRRLFETKRPDELPLIRCYTPSSFPLRPSNATFSRSGGR